MATSALITPSVLFLALTGALQLFSLHEAHGVDVPAPIVERLGRLHKDQVSGSESVTGRLQPKCDLPPSHPWPVKAGRKNNDQTATTTFLLKCSFLIVELGLALSSVFGIWIAISHPRSRKVTVVLVLIGVIVPMPLLIV